MSERTDTPRTDALRTDGPLIDSPLTDSPQTDSPVATVEIVQPTMPWPPLIVATTAPGWVRRRDFFLTLLMWVLFALMLETEFELFFGHYLERLGWGDFSTEANWAIFFQRLRPYFRIVVVLAVALAVASVRTLLRRHRSLRLAPALPLPPDEEAADVGLDAATVAAAREWRVSVLHIEPDGRYRVERRV